MNWDYGLQMIKSCGPPPASLLSTKVIVIVYYIEASKLNSQDFNLLLFST